MDKKTILLVEDEALLAIHEKEQLSKYGYEVVLANSGEKAVMMCDAGGGIDLILMDINLGKGMDGTEAARQILDKRDIPIVFLSSHTEPEVVAKTEQITSYGYVVKNSSITVLDASIKMAFRLFAADKALKIKEKYQRALLDNFPFAVWLKDTESRFLSINSGFTGVFGAATVDELIGKTDYDIAPRALAEVYREDDADVMRTGKNKNVEEPIMTNGKLTWFETYKAPVFDDTGELLGSVGFARDISERKHAENLLKDIIRKNPVSIQILDKDGFTIEVNPSFIALFGSKPPEGYSTFKDGQLLRKGFGEFFSRLREGRTVEFPDIYYNAHDSVPEVPDVPVWVKTTGFSLVDRDGKPEKYILMQENISLQKTAEKRLRDSEETFRLMIKNSSDSIVRINEKGEQVYISDAAERDTGYSIEELKGPISNVIIPEDLDLVMNAWNRVLANKDEPVRVQYRHKHKYKDFIWYEAVAQNFLGDPAINAVIVNVRDITSNKAIETELQKAKAKAEESESRLRAIFENSKDAIGIHRQGVTVMVNRAFVEMFGYEDERGLLAASLLDRIAPAERERIKGFMDKRNKGEEAPLFYESVGLRRDGSEFPYEINIGTYFFDGEMYSVGIIRDITERKIAEKELKRQLGVNEIVLKEVHHRIKNNINSIESLLSLQSGSTDNPEVRAALQTAATRVQSMRVLYTRLLAEDAYHEVSVKEYAESLIDSIADVFPDGGRITVDREIGDFTLSTQKVFPLGMIINELFTNAMKYAFSGRESGHIRISLSKAENHAILRMDDDGNGIPADKSADASHGFGLMLVKMLCVQLDGTFSVEQNFGVRCTVKFKI